MPREKETRIYKNTYARTRTHTQPLMCVCVCVYVCVCVCVLSRYCDHLWTRRLFWVTRLIGAEDWRQTSLKTFRKRQKQYKETKGKSPFREMDFGPVHFSGYLGL